MSELRSITGHPPEDGADYDQNAGTRGEYLRSRVLKRSIMVGRHKTSVSLEDVFWNELRAIARNLGMHLSQLVARIDIERQHGNLSSAIRLFVFEHRCRNPENAPPQHDDHHSATVRPTSRN